MTKPLSQLLTEVEPANKWIDLGFSHLTDTPHDHVKPCNIIDRASYDKLKAIAVELANGLEYIANPYPQDNVEYLKRNANVNLTTARKMLGDGEK